MKNIPQQYKALVTNKIQLNYKVIQVTLQINEPTEILFKAGQFINVQVAEGMYRAYSIASSPSSSKEIKLIIEIGHNGYGSDFFRNIKIGDDISFIGPAGIFTLSEMSTNKMVFIATGTGIAPIISILDHLAESHKTTPIELYYGIRNENELILKEQLAAYQSKLQNFTYLLCFSQSLPRIIDKTTVLGRVTNVIQLKHISDTHYYVCGNPLMVQDICKMLRQHGVLNENIVTEKFSVTN
jgi:ferredoxin-NADP reductase